MQSIPYVSYVLIFEFHPLNEKNRSTYFILSIHNLNTGLSRANFYLKEKKLASLYFNVTFGKIYIFGSRSMETLFLGHALFLIIYINNLKHLVK
jgi:hypothetical protein